MYYGMALCVRSPVCLFVRLFARKNKEGIGSFFFIFGVQVYLGVPSIDLSFVVSCLIKYAHNDLIIHFSIFGIHNVIFLS